MVQFDHEEIFDLCVGLFLFVISMLLIGFFMARMARDEQEEYEEVNICCFNNNKKGKNDNEREFASLNDLLLEVDKNETARVIKKEERIGSVSSKTKSIATNTMERKESTDLCETEREHNDDPQSFSFRTIFPSILQDSSSSATKKTMSELEEPLLLSPNHQN